MTTFLRQLMPSTHTGRQFVTAQHLTVLEGTLSLHDYLKQVGERIILRHPRRTLFIFPTHNDHKPCI
ncbi:hypothetical protein V2H77_14415 [Photorhabdus sp. P32]|uniref:hypothetical protein n=1 Tax=Photorhabdus sp. P32 TaxID=3117549 RepID=UPI00311AC728